MPSEDRLEDKEFVPDNVSEASSAASDEVIGSNEEDGKRISSKAAKVSVYNFFIVNTQTHCFDSVRSSASFASPSGRHARLLPLVMLSKNEKQQLRRRQLASSKSSAYLTNNRNTYSMVSKAGIQEAEKDAVRE